VQAGPTKESPQSTTAETQCAPGSNVSHPQVIAELALILMGESIFEE
jgi:hypothetical protein